MLKDCQGDIANLSHDDYYKLHEIQSDNQKNFKEKLAWFNKVNAILETLPQFDCGSCGFANCRGLASKIASGEVDDSLCRVKSR
jgi:ArsR family metal-binding transcriptional regulator